MSSVTIGSLGDHRVVWSLLVAVFIAPLYWKF
jgi:hypothetical protein